MRPVRIPGTLCLCIAAAAVAALLIRPQPAEADYSSSSVKELAAYLEENRALNLQLMALDALRQKNDSGVEAELEKIAKGSDARLAIYATTQLGRKGTSAAKAKLKALVTSSAVGTTVRKSAMTAIAVHWESAADLDWLEDATASDAALRGHCKLLGSRVYGQYRERGGER